MIKYILFKLIHRLALILPRNWCYWIGCRTADIDYLLKGKLRKAVKANLRHIHKTVYSAAPSKSLISADAKAVFRNFAKYLVDFFSFAEFNRNNINEKIKVNGLENMRGAFCKGKGVIGLTAHIGNWELCAVVTALLGFDVNAVVLSHDNTKINRLFTNQRAAKGINVIPVGSSPGIYVDVLRKNRLIALVGDRTNSDKGIMLDFFKKPALIPKGPAILSLRTGAPIVPGFMIRTKDDKFELVFEKPIDPSDFSQDNSHAVEEITKSVVSVMERHISENPSQWFLFYKVWR